MKYLTSTVLIIYFSFLIFPNSARAQGSTFPILSMNIQTIPIANDTSSGLPDFSDSTIFSATMHISLFDTTNIDQICVTLSDSDSSSNRLTHTFNWDVSGSTGNGTSYLRNGYEITLGLGNFMNLLSYDAAVSIRRNDGSFTDAVNFSR